MTLPVPTSRPVAFFNLEDEVWGIGCFLRELPPCGVERYSHYHSHWSMTFCLRHCQAKKHPWHRSIPSGNVRCLWPRRPSLQPSNPALSINMVTTQVHQTGD